MVTSKKAALAAEFGARALVNLKGGFSYRLQVNIYMHVSFVFNISFCGFPCFFFFVCKCFTSLFCSLVNVFARFFSCIITRFFFCFRIVKNIYNKTV